MKQLLGHILIGLLLSSLSALPAHAINVDDQNQIYAQAGEKVRITYVSADNAGFDRILNVFIPSSQFSIDTKKDRVGRTVDLDTFKAQEEMIFQLLDPKTGFSLYNDPRNNIDLENHVKITPLGKGKLQVGWQLSDGDGKFEDLVFTVEVVSSPRSVTPQKAAASSWRLYE